VCWVSGFACRRPCPMVFLVHRLRHPCCIARRRLRKPIGDIACLARPLARGRGTDPYIPLQAPRCWIRLGISRPCGHKHADADQQRSSPALRQVARFFSAACRRRARRACRKRRCFLFRHIKGRLRHANQPCWGPRGYLWRLPGHHCSHGGQPVPLFLTLAGTSPSLWG
jgi:hypothetical protein